MALTAGSCLGPYEVVAPLSAGGMGEVYRARDPRRDASQILGRRPGREGLTCGVINLGRAYS